MGKSASGAVWLNADLFSPYDFWQYFRNTEDADVGKFLKIFTRLPLDEIAKLAALGGSELNEAKKILATEVTAIVHGREAAEQPPRRHPRPSRRARSTCRCRPPRYRSRTSTAGIGLLAALVTAGLAASNGEARRHIQSGAVRVNDEPVTDDRATLTYGRPAPRKA